MVVHSFTRELDSGGRLKVSLTLRKQNKTLNSEVQQFAHSWTLKFHPGEERTTQAFQGLCLALCLLPPTDFLYVCKREQVEWTDLHRTDEQRRRQTCCSDLKSYEGHIETLEMINEDN